MEIKLFSAICVIILLHICDASPRFSLSKSSSSSFGTCRNEEYQCEEGTCLDRNLLCNGMTDCVEGEDEDNHLCSFNSFSCSNSSLHCVDAERYSKYKRSILRQKRAAPCTLPQKTSGLNYVVGGCAPDDASPACRGIPGSVVDINKQIYLITTCQKGYQLTGANMSVCINGQWLPPSSCAADCGVRVTPVRPLLSGAKAADITQFPWHVGIYEVRATGLIEQICGGSLISLSLILSAAHCFFDNLAKRQKDQSLYRVAAGKYFREWTRRADDPATFECKIKQIILHQRYRGREQSYGYDIALIKLQQDVPVSEYIRPICMDWRGEFERIQIKAGNKGVVAGWGYIDTSSTPSEVLRASELPVIDFEICLNTVPQEFRSLITADKFCAGYRNGTGVCEGDSGGGMAFYNGKKFFLRGIVNISPKSTGSCYNEKYALFTLVNYFIISGWINEASTLTYEEESSPGGTGSDCSLPEKPAGGDYFVNGCEGSKLIEHPLCRKVPGTAATNGVSLTYTCGQGYKLKKNTGQVPVVYCLNGVWTPKLPTCTRSEIACGIWPSGSGPAPWHVGIYRLDGNYKYACSGNIISPRFVLSVATCFWDQTSKTQYDERLFRVVAGKWKRDWNIPESGSQEQRVQLITLPSRFVGRSNFFSMNIALLRLADQLTLSPRVQPVCLDREKETPQYGDFGEITSWDISTSPPGRYIETNDLKTVGLPVVHYRDCRESVPEVFAPFITDDKFCAGYRNGTGMCPKSLGSGLVFNVNGKWTLRGLISLGPSKKGSLCFNEHYSVFTSVDDFLTWINSEIRGACFPLSSLSADISCVYQRQNVPCGRRQSPGTVATFQCKPNYELPKISYNSISCQADGEWDNPPFDCKTICGISKKGSGILSEFPWHVGIYMFGSNGYSQKCSGTIISRKLVLTAAHCFYNNKRGTYEDTDQYRVIAGKLAREYGEEADEQTQQVRLVKSLAITDRYRGRESNFVSDIITVEVKQPFVFNNIISPACVDWTKSWEKFQLKTGSVGKISSWAIATGPGPYHVSPTLKSAQLPYVDFNECYDNFPETFKPFVTNDKFCAGVRTGTSMCPTSGGAGLMFEREGHWYIVGVSSVGPLERNVECLTTQYTTFTKVSDFLRQIEPVFQRLE